MNFVKSSNSLRCGNRTNLCNKNIELRYERFSFQLKQKDFDVKNLVRIGIETDTSIDLYQLKKVQIIGKGGYGTVFTAIDCSTNNQYAVKVINDLKYERFKEEVKQELELVKELNHPNIIKVYDSFMTPKTGYLVMEACLEGDLFYHITDYYPFNNNKIRLFSWQMVSAVKYLHHLSIAHRDIKSENFLITNGRLKLCDFGLAGKFRDRCLVGIGITEFSSPQMIQNNYDPFKADIWALGCVIFELWFLMPPFLKWKLKIAAKNSKMPEFVIPKTISSSCRDLMKHMIEYKEEKRYDIDQVSNHEWFRCERD